MQHLQREISIFADGNISRRAAGRRATGSLCARVPHSGVDNNIVPGPVPPELADLTDAEELLIVRIKAVWPNHFLVRGGMYKKMPEKDLIKRYLFSTFTHTLD